MTAYRIVVAGETAMYEREFDGQPTEGDTFAHGSGLFRVKSVHRDPIGPQSPEMPLGVERISTAKHWA
jgi:hypothetical protein